MSNKKQEALQTLGDVFSERRGRQGRRSTLEKWALLGLRELNLEAWLGKHSSLFESKPGHFLTDPGGKAAHFALNQQDTGLGRKVLQVSVSCVVEETVAPGRGPPPTMAPPTPSTEFPGLSGSPRAGRQEGAEVKAISLGMMIWLSLLSLSSAFLSDVSRSP